MRLIIFLDNILIMATSIKELTLAEESLMFGVCDIHQKVSL